MNLQAHTLDGEQVHFSIDVLPDRCPQCHTAVHPKLLSQHLSGNKDEAYLTLLCTSHRCLRPFVATYRQDFQRHQNYKLRFTAPRTVAHSSFPESIRGVSPTFCKIAEQVESARAAGLDQLVGIGLRKALEFLVKDFSKSQHPERSEAIESMRLGKCIDDYISDPNVLQCAKRAAWLGNDETHYLRKWSDRDVNDLNLLVRLTTNWVDNFILTKKYVSEMSGEV